MSINLYDFRGNLYSQNGEDGIIEKLLSILKIDTGYFVEFGAWDGKHWSNTYRLYEKGWKGCLIESEVDRFRALCNNIPDDNVLKVNSRVAESGENSLDEILKRNGIGNVDFLSIDIDSDDLRVWEAVKSVDPPVVVIEYNSVIPFDTRYVNPIGKMHGNSALSIVESAQDRGYSLVEGTDTNLIFVKEDLIGSTDAIRKSLQEIMDQTYQLRYFFGHDGTLLHDYAALNEEGITEIFPIPFQMTFGVQPVPRPFRRIRNRINFPGFLFFVFSAILRCPVQLFKLVRLFVRTLSKGRSLPEIISLLLNKESLVRALKEE